MVAPDQYLQARRLSGILFPFSSGDLIHTRCYGSANATPRNSCTIESMNRVLILFTLIMFVLIGCDFEPDISPLSPFQCRVTGVDVDETDTVTGTIDHICEHDSIEMTMRHCKQPFNEKLLGCAVPINDGAYVVHFRTVRQPPEHTAYNTVLNHELCHAYYEEPKHVW